MARQSEAKGSPAKKGSSAAKGRNLRGNAGRAQEQPRPQAQPVPDGTGRDIAGVALGVVAVASFIAVVSSSTAPVTVAISQFYHLGYGLGAYVLPFVILAFAVGLFLRDRSPISGRTAAGAAIVFVCVLALLSLSVPYTSLTTNAMFEAENLSAFGGYVGAFVASFLQEAFGKGIARVILVGAIVAGFVIIGFSISDFVQQLAAKAADVRAHHELPLNQMPWGGPDKAAEAPAGGRRKPATDEETAKTTYLGGRETTVLEREDAPDGDEDPFVDLSEELAAERAETVLIPVRDRFVQVTAPIEVTGPSDRPGEHPAAAMPMAEGTAQPQGAPSDAAGADEEAPRWEGPFTPFGVDDDPDLPLGADSTPEAVEPLEFLEPLQDEGEQDGAPGPGAGAARLIDLNDDDPVGADAPVKDAGPASEAPVPDALPDFLRQGAAKGAPGDVVAAKAAAPARPTAAAHAKEPAAAPAKPGASEVPERQLPPVSMLRHNPNSASPASSAQELERTSEALQATLAEFGLHAKVVGWISGPTVTTFKVQPGEGERVSRISNLEDDIALSLAAQSVRIFAPIPGTSLVGIEIPNAKRQNVNLADVLPYVKGGPLELAIGRDAEGSPVVADLAKMPHLLIAGTTGSGKSVMINSIVMTLLMRTLPEDVRLIMVDPKRVELAGYNGLPHLYVPVVTEPKQAASALSWAVSEMERRLKIFERLSVRKISTYNSKQAAGEFEHYDNPPRKMPYLVIIIDELSDLMMVAGKDVEASIVRIAQLGRAAGIHLIVATQRPSSNVVTGLIKANITNRIAFNVATGVDSRVIIDQVGAEKLTGLGDMLFSKVGWGKPKRIQGCFVSDEEISQVVEFVKEQGETDYHEEILSAVAPATVAGAGTETPPDEDDPLLWNAAHIVVDSQLGSTSGLQRRLKVGYARAGRIMDMLEEKGVVGPPDGSKPREVLLDKEGLAALEALESPLTREEVEG